MDVLTEWVKHVLLIVLFATSVELLLPHNNMQRFIRFILGLYIMITILNPFISIVEKSFSLEGISSVLGELSVKSKSKRDVSALTKEKERLSEEVYVQEVKRQICSMITSMEYVKKVDADIEIDKESKKISFPIIKVVNILIKSDKDDGLTTNDFASEKRKEGLKKKVGQLVSEIYQIPKDAIRVQILME